MPDLSCALDAAAERHHEQRGVVGAHGLFDGVNGRVAGAVVAVAEHHEHAASRLTRQCCTPRMITS